MLGRVGEWEAEIRFSVAETTTEVPFWYFGHTHWAYSSAEAAEMRVSLENQVAFQTHLFNKYGEGWLRETTNTPENCPYLEDLRCQTHDSSANNVDLEFEAWCRWDELVGRE
jgi:hypothetical protein